ncbi:MAG: TSUP family transporter [Gammaproteobacteria bacterium]|jgi:hypothetical protein|nr:TSUP family transporter [Gammaproteobacteria bacterium]MBT3488900.1 TSUP family transporter [Gammaproteobacteria bacterium]MBT3718563.1 TSUP family transporter [Gammaproteobacteria bacterium]MBT3844468.1 TSUP family transporter [Gammaproteobacteria bacterium]MBT3891922.1 TSUP family transporter [Gammaproteobacteria bacterium]
MDHQARSGQDVQGKRLSHNNIIFCKKGWRLPALLLAVFSLLTFLWGFYILENYLEEFELEEYAINSLELGMGSVTSGGMLNVAAQHSGAQRVDVVGQQVKPALVHIQMAKQQQGVGPLASGVLVHPDGYVVTALHPLLNIDKLQVGIPTPQGPRHYKAKLIQQDPAHNLALLKLKTRDRFLYLKLADTSQITSGYPVIAIGLGQQGMTLSSQGSVLQRGEVIQSRLGASITRLLRTDAVSVSGQVGGALVSSNNELVGINLPVVTGQGVVDGYAVPSHVIYHAFQKDVKFTVGTTLTPPAGMSTQTQVEDMRFVGPGGSLQTVNVAATQGTNPATTSAAPSGMASDVDHVVEFRLGGHTIEAIMGLGLLGLFSGLVGGFMTMGGGIILVSGMFLFFGYGMLLIRPVAFVTNVFTYGASSWKNWQTGFIQWGLVKQLIPWALVGAVVGYFIGSAMNDEWIGYLLGIFALIMGGRTLHEIFNHREEYELELSDEGDEGDEDQVSVVDQLKENTTVRHGLLGLPMGLVSGLLGISGGVVQVPLLRYLEDIRWKNAIANSSIMVFSASLVAAVVSLIHGTVIGAYDLMQPLGLAMVLIPTSYLGGVLGARWLKMVSVDGLKWLYAGLMLVIGIKMLILS